MKQTYFTRSESDRFDVLLIDGEHRRLLMHTLQWQQAEAPPFPSAVEAIEGWLLENQAALRTRTSQVPLLQTAPADVAQAFLQVGYHECQAELFEITQGYCQELASKEPIIF